MNGIRVYYCRNAVEGNIVPAELADLGMREDVALEAVPCGGRVDPRYILKAFEGGAYAVCVLTCPISHCKLMEGNIRATRRVELAREMLAEAGIDPEAVQIIMPSEPGEVALGEAIESIASFVEKSSRTVDGVIA
jgi:coenzyme F420-reducing hydrogenase delta subunit